MVEMYLKTRGAQEKARTYIRWRIEVPQEEVTVCAKQRLEKGWLYLEERVVLVAPPVYLLLKGRGK